MQIISTNNLYLATLQLACNFGIGVFIALITDYTSVHLVGLQGIQKKTSFPLLWVLIGIISYGGMVWVIQKLDSQGFTIPLTSLVFTVLPIAILAWRRFSRAKYSAKESSITPPATQPEHISSQASTSPQASNAELLALLDNPACFCMATDGIPTRHSAHNHKSMPDYLIEREAPYRLLTQPSSNLVSRHTPEGIYLYASPACFALLGYEADELVGHSAYEFFHPQDLAKIRQINGQESILSELTAVSYRIRCQSGDYIWFESTTTSIRDRKTGVVEEIVTVSRDITEQKQVEETLQERERQLQKLATDVPGMIYQFLLQADGSISFPFVSSGAREIYELEPTDIQENAAAIIDLIHPDDRASFENSVATSAQTLLPWRWEGRVVLASGQLKWLQAASRPELQANGNILWDGVLMDITERKQAEAALHESEELFRATFEHTGVAIAQVGVQGQFLRVNQKLCEITGYTQEELLRKTVLEITDSDDQTVTQVYLHQIATSQKQTVNLEKRYIHKTGSLVWVNVTVSVVRKSSGEPKYFISVIEDITERKQAQADCHRANSDRSNILESITEAFIALDREWRFTYINSQAEQILSRPAAQLLGRCVWDEFPSLVGSPLEQQFRQAVAEQDSIKFEEFYATGKIWFLVRAYPHEGGLAVYCSDITERKQAEAILVERSRMTTLSATVGVALASGGTLQAILQRCTEAIVQQLDATNAALWMLSPRSGQLEQQASAGQLTPLNSVLISANTERNQSNSSRESLEASHKSLRPNYLSGYPLVVDTQPIGVMTLLIHQPLSAAAEETLRWVANAIAVAVDRSWARSELLSRRESLLFGLANQIRNSLELDTILETAVDSIRSLLQIDRCHFLWYRHHDTQPYWEVVNEAKNPVLPSHMGQYTVAQVEPFTSRLLNRQIIRVDEVETTDNSAVQQLLLSLGYTSILVIPIATQSGEIGVICCGHCTSVRPWDESEVELVQAVVAQLAIAIDQAELYTQARQAALTAQAQAQQLEATLQQLRTTQAQLVQSAKMYSLGQLIAGIAHEINNPVNFIHGNLTYASAYFYDLLSLLQLYQEHYPNPGIVILEQAEVINIDFIAKDLPKLLNSMQRGTDRIRSIVLSLRNFSRLDEAEMKQVDLHEGIDSTLLVLQHRFKPKDTIPEIQIVKEYGSLPRVECYPGQLNQVFINILSNAIEAFEQSEPDTLQHASPTITIRTSIIDRTDSTQHTPKLREPESYNTPDTTTLSHPNPASVVIQIADNAPGMTESVRARIFDPFFTAKPFGQGIGLGLSISYQIVVEHHHGILSCTSIPGQGSEFWIEIPIAQTQ